MSYTKKNNNNNKISHIQLLQVLQEMLQVDHS